MKIITGKTATEHINSEDDRGLHAGIFGSDSYVLNTNTKLQISIESSTTIRINSGDLIHQGCHARIPYSEYDEVTIDAGTTGYKRIDLIVARYEKSAGLESMSLVAIKGQPAASTPVAPDYNHGNILQGASISDMPLYQVTLDGVNIESITSLFNVISTMNDRYNKQEIDNKVTALSTAISQAQGTANTGVQKADAAQETANTGVSIANAAIPKSAIHHQTVTLTRNVEGGSTMDYTDFTVDNFSNSSILLCIKSGNSINVDGNAITQIDVRNDVQNMRVWYDSTGFGESIDKTLYWINI